MQGDGFPIRLGTGLAGLDVSSKDARRGRPVPRSEALGCKGVRTSVLPMCGTQNIV